MPMANENMRDMIENYLKEHSQARVDDLWRHFGLSRVIIHKHLKHLLHAGKVARVGKPPLVFYLYLNGDTDISRPSKVVSEKLKKVIESTYLYVTPLGEMINGLKGFEKWVQDIKETKHLENLAVEYVKSRTQADSFLNRYGYINATERIKQIFPNTALDRLYYLDFYSLPKFGKTKLGQLVLYSKQSQKISLIEEVIPHIKKSVMSIVKRMEVDAVGFIPPTIPRKYQFQKELEKKISLSLSNIELNKAYLGDVPVAQKTLSKIEDRIINARGSIYIKDVGKKYNTVLLIDDAVGSGATLNETALKIKQSGIAKTVIGLSIVGSYNGFEVIKEI
jgi:predicted transcriptional regulator